MNNEYYLEPQLVKQSFQQAATTYDEVAILQREVGTRLIQRLAFLKITPEIILDLGCSTGYQIKALENRYENATVLGLDIAHDFLNKQSGKAICANALALPFQDQSIDFIYSNLMFQWLSNIEDALKECFRVLKPGGLLLFTTLGPHTLQECRASWETIDDDIHVNAFFDMHDIGDALLKSQYSDPVMDSEIITLTYQTTQSFMQDLKQLGASNRNQGRSKTLTGKNKFQQFKQAFEQYRNEEGVLPASYDVIYGHAWKLEKSVKKGETSIPISSIGKMKKQ